MKKGIKLATFAEMAEKSLYCDLLYFFQRNPKYRFTKKEIVAILRMTLDQMSRYQSEESKTGVL